MPGQFLSPDGDLESAFVSDTAIIDQFAKTGSLWAWGSSDQGQLGDNTGIGGSKSSPVQTSSLGTNWASCSGGLYTSSGIKTDGTLWTWGYNYSGTIGDGTNYTNEAYKSTPIQVAGTTWKQVSMNNSAAAIKTDGTLWVWGTNNLGELGDNTLNSKSSPVQTVAGGNNWKLVYSGRYSKAAIKTDSTLWMWGHGNYGQLGDGTTVSKSSPVQIAGTNWKMVSAGVYFSAAIKTDGTLWSWGRNNYSQLGNGDNTNRSSPVQTISSGTNWKSMATGGYHSAAIKTDGTLWTWGRNTEGQLGDGTTTERNSPVQISGTTWKLLAAGKYCTAAIKTDGTLWTWGQAQQGLLGDGTTANKSSPVQIKGNNWKMVSCAAYHMLAIHFYDAGNLYP
jgi:alpha-tubulin suppressor-like RCC1 family protein